MKWKKTKTRQSQAPRPRYPKSRNASATGRNDGLISLNLLFCLFGGSPFSSSLVSVRLGFRFLFSSRISQLYIPQPIVFNHCFLFLAIIQPCKYKHKASAHGYIMHLNTIHVYLKEEIIQLG